MVGYGSQSSSQNEERKAGEDELNLLMSSLADIDKMNERDTAVTEALSSDRRDSQQTFSMDSDLLSSHLSVSVPKLQLSLVSNRSSSMQHFDGMQFLTVELDQLYY